MLLASRARGGAREALRQGGDRILAPRPGMALASPESLDHPGERWTRWGAETCNAQLVVLLRNQGETSGSSHYISTPFYRKLRPVQVDSFFRVSRNTLVGLDLICR